MKKIVVAEASSTIKSVADSLLRQNGFDVYCTSDGLQAWEVITAEKPDLVIAGAVLSGISGLELCRQMVGDRISGGIPTIIMYGAKDPVKQEDILSCGARGQLKKPFSPRDLLDIVNKLVGATGDTSAAKIKTSVDRESEKTFHGVNVQSTGVRSESSKKVVYNLDWSDLNETGGKKGEQPKVKSIDLSSEDQGLSIEEDQYGLTSTDEARDNAVFVGKKDKDEDYDWFLNEMQRELENKPLAADHGKIREEKSFNTPKPAPEKISAGNLNYDDIKAPAKSTDYEDFISGIDVGEEEIPKLGEPARALPVTPIIDKFKSEPHVKLSESEIDLIANQIATKLATAIAAKIDKSQIVQIIKNSLG